MKDYYLVGFGQPGDRIVYYTGVYTSYGSELLGNVDQAYLFDSMEDVCAYLLKNYETRCIIVEIADVTLERIQEGYKAITLGTESEHTNLYKNFNRVSYVTNSK